MESSSSIELKVLNGENLKVYNYFQKPVVYVQVAIASDDPSKKVDQHRQQQQRTTTVKEGDGHPEWNQDMRFELTDAMVEDHDHLFFQFDLRHEGLVFGDKPIGEVRVPFGDLIEDPSGGIVRFVSYEVRTPDGKPNGVLNFSYKVNLKGRDLGANSNSPADGKITGYPVVEHDHYSPLIQYPTSEVQYPAPESPNFGSGAHPVTQEAQYSSPRAPYPPRDGYYPPPPDGYYPPPPPPTMPPPGLHGPRPPMVHAATIHHHHHHHHGPRPNRVHPWVSDPHRHSGGYDYSPRRWGPGGGKWADWYSSSSWNGR